MVLLIQLLISLVLFTFVLFKEIIGEWYKNILFARDDGSYLSVHPTSAWPRWLDRLTTGYSILNLSKAMIDYLTILIILTGYRQGLKICWLKISSFPKKIKIYIKNNKINSIGNSVVFVR